MAVGVNLTFFPQHFLGVTGMPRRYAHYPDGYFFWNFISSYGSELSLVRLYVFLFLVWEGLFSERSLVFSDRTRPEWLKDNHPYGPHNLPQNPINISYLGSLWEKSRFEFYFGVFNSFAIDFYSS
jgi:heme/copper-type cytochrome/quinol oxidase subunit 1